MNKARTKLLSIATALILIICILNISVVTKQGVDCRLHEIKLPLYLKILNFVDRHYNYKHIVKSITGDTKDDNAKAIKILNWVYTNVRKSPKELPSIDDHPLHVLIRGYGAGDQFEDIFTILCTYAGMDAFFKMFLNSSNRIYYISFVKIRGKWCPLSAFDGVYLTKNGSIASVNDILLDKKLLAPFISNLGNFETDTFLREIDNIDFNVWSVRAKGQSPGGRLLCIIRKFLYPNRVI
ncbi:MAG: hypothetical protein Q8R38_06170 [Candidatus Omnitrophota bacterium]|nr:hypothetical protein [Candidatus Omnitrophota bacterium]